MVSHIWNSKVKQMPKYSVLEVCTEDVINFDKKDEMTARILDKAVELYIKTEEYPREKEQTNFCTKSREGKLLIFYN
ncbi:hypothetical protein [Aminipila sp.]|uniref:hypothetical protein n=1 Tax=Aminipila sp. TaxID=2060095 RepID=UPI000ED49B84|nr:hypothetical protein [Aminipila sp.]HCX62119.1 hypothetical protein [Clostridiales bacterium]